MITFSFSISSKFDFSTLTRFITWLTIAMFLFLSRSWLIVSSMTLTKISKLQNMILFDYSTKKIVRLQFTMFFMWRIVFIIFFHSINFKSTIVSYLSLKMNSLLTSTTFKFYFDAIFISCNWKILSFVFR